MTSHRKDRTDHACQIHCVICFNLYVCAFQAEELVWIVAHHKYYQKVMGLWCVHFFSAGFTRVLSSMWLSIIPEGKNLWQKQFRGITLTQPPWVIDFGWVVKGLNMQFQQVCRKHLVSCGRKLHLVDLKVKCVIFRYFAEEMTTLSGYILGCSTFHSPSPYWVCQWGKVPCAHKPGPSSELSLAHVMIFN